MTKQSPSQHFLVSSREGKAKTNQLISIRLPQELIERLALVGNDESLSMSDTIRLVLERGLRASSKKKGS